MNAIENFKEMFSNNSKSMPNKLGIPLDNN